MLIGVATTLGTAVPVGYNIGVVNTPFQHIKNWCNVTLIDSYDLHLTEDQLDVLFSAVVSIFLVGACIGSLSGAWLADKYGR